MGLKASRDDISQTIVNGPGITNCSVRIPIDPLGGVAAAPRCWMIRGSTNMPQYILQKLTANWIDPILNGYQDSRFCCSAAFRGTFGHFVQGGRHNACVLLAYVVASS